MEIAEAYEILGVEPGTDAKKARRAYLRLIKVHKPETDPEGFQRIREAYERIKKAPEWELRGATDAPHEPNDDAVKAWGAAPKKSWADQARESLSDAPPPPKHERPAPAPAPPLAPGEVTIQVFFDRCNGATDAERVAIGREAIAALPDDGEAYWLLHDALLVTSQMAEAAETLRAAHQRGLPGFLEPLLRQHPERLSDAELAEAKTAAGVSIATLTVADCLLRRGDAEGAADAMTHGIAEAAQGRDSWAPSVHMALDFVLRLFREGHPAPARRSFEAFSTWLRDSGRETELHGSQAAATYALVKELTALPKAFPPPLLGSLGRGLLDGDPAFAIPELLSWMDRQPESRKQLEEYLLLYAPTLHAAVKPAFEMASGGFPQNIASNLPPQQPILHWKESPPKKKVNGWAIALAIFAVLIAARVILKVVKRPAAPPPSYVGSPIVDPSQLGLGATDEELELAAVGVCTWDSGSLCADAQEVRNALQAGDCDTAKAAFARMRLAVLSPEDLGSSKDRAITRHAVPFRFAVQRRCGFFILDGPGGVGEGRPTP
ncbi:MAG: J domain-containing protein [Myxococcota bacterium]